MLLTVVTGKCEKSYIIKTMKTIIVQSRNVLWRITITLTPFSSCRPSSSSSALYAGVTVVTTTGAVVGGPLIAYHIDVNRRNT